MDGWLSQFCESKRQYMLEFLLYFCTSLWAKTKTDPWPCFKLKRINLSIGSCSEIFLCFSCIARPVCAQIESCLADFHLVTLSKCWQLACIINHAASAWISQSHLPPPSAPPPLAPLHIQPAGHSSGWPRWGDWIHVARLQREGRKKRLKWGINLYCAVSDCSQSWEMVFRSSTSSPGPLIYPRRQTLPNY